MKLVYAFFAIFLITLPAFSQIEKGEYQVCLDYCHFEKCHGKYIFNFLDKDSCQIVWIDDVSFEKSMGFYHLTDSSIELSPQHRPDSIRIDLVFDNNGLSTNQSYTEFKPQKNENVIWLMDLSGNRLKDVSLSIYRDNHIAGNFKTDSLGYVRYFGNVADSVHIEINGRIFKIIPNRNNKPSWIKIYINFHFLDLFDRIRQLRKEYNVYWFEYECEGGIHRESPMIKLK